MTQQGWHRRLAVRLIFFLSVALIPVGLVAVLQTGDIVRQARERDSNALISLTRDAAFAQREAIQRAFGKATGLIPVAYATNDTPARCSQLLAQFIAAQDELVTAGIIGTDGRLWCSSRGNEGFDFSEFPNWSDAVADPQPAVEINPEAPISGQPVVITSQPYFTDGVLTGFIFVSLPHSMLAAPTSVPVAQDLTILSFTETGRLLTSSKPEQDDPLAILPAGRALEDLVGETHRTFTTETNNGETRSYAVSPIVHNTAYVMGTWTPVTAVSSSPIAIPPQVFPIIMWITSLCVAFATVYRLVIRHISRLRRNMRDFASDRHLPRPEAKRDVSSEIAELQLSFVSMAETVLQDEAELERLLHDRTVLLKEVHHRVKNNLQLISSIMNMQMRQLKSPEALQVVQRLQDRVIGLATIHRNLYRTENLSSVSSKTMLLELTDQIFAVARSGKNAGRVERDIDDITLFPDQAMPLSLLVAEAVTNALKYIDASGDGWLKIRLDASEDGEVLVEILNSRAPETPASETDEALEGTGLGSNLMRAFASQLGGQLEIDETATLYTLRVSFLRQGFVADADAEEAA